MSSLLPPGYVEAQSVAHTATRVAAHPVLVTTPFLRADAVIAGCPARAVRDAFRGEPMPRTRALWGRACGVADRDAAIRVGQALVDAGYVEEAPHELPVGNGMAISVMRAVSRDDPDDEPAFWATIRGRALAGASTRGVRRAAARAEMPRIAERVAAYNAAGPVVGIGGVIAFGDVLDGEDDERIGALDVSAFLRPVGARHGLPADYAAARRVVRGRSGVVREHPWALVEPALAAGAARVLVCLDEQLVPRPAGGRAGRRGSGH